MGVQSNEGAVMFSSMALLPQRFRELERIKEKREVRLLQIITPHEANLPHPQPQGVGGSSNTVAAAEQLVSTTTALECKTIG